MYPSGKKYKIRTGEYSSKHTRMLGTAFRYFRLTWDLHSVIADWTGKCIPRYQTVPGTAAEVSAKDEKERQHVVFIEKQTMVYY